MFKILTTQLFDYSRRLSGSRGYATYQLKPFKLSTRNLISEIRNFQYRITRKKEREKDRGECHATLSEPQELLLRGADQSQNATDAPNFQCSLYRILPRQLCPSLMNPGSQKHLNDPTVFEDMVLSLLQLRRSSAHSSM